MALIKCAGFDYLTPLAPASALASLGFTNCTILPGQGRAGGGCAKLGQLNLPSRPGTFYCGFAILNPSGITINFNDSTKGTNFSLKFTSAGAITVTPQSSANAVSSPPMAVIPGAVWQYLEVYGVISSVSGAVTVRVNETVVLSMVSANTATVFTLLRTVGEAAEPVGYIFSADLSAVYVAGVLQDPTSYTFTSPNQLTFNTAPAYGSQITATFRYYFICRFSSDSQDFEEFMANLWTLHELKLTTVIP